MFQSVNSPFKGGLQRANPRDRHCARSASPAPTLIVEGNSIHGRIVPLEIATRQASRIIQLTVSAIFNHLMFAFTQPSPNR